MSEEATGHRKEGCTVKLSPRARILEKSRLFSSSLGWRTMALKISGKNCDRTKSQDTWVHTLDLPQTCPQRNCR